MLSGDNGILQRATDAKTKSDEAQIKERIQLAYHSALTKDITGESGELTMPTLQEALNNEFTGKTVTITPSVDNKEWIIKVDEVEETVPAGKDTTPQVATLPSRDGTNPYLPSSSFSQLDGTDLSTGLVITDEVNEDGNSIGNEYVWIEVPRTASTYGNSFNLNYDFDNMTEEQKNTAYSAIATALRSYVSDIITETDGSEVSRNNKTTTVGFSDTWYLGCGIADSSAYITLYNKMLKSIYENGGFWIGRYEAGMTGDTGRVDENVSIDGVIPLSKPNLIPIFYVTCNQAQTISTRVENKGIYNSSLMFGIQWDLVLKHLKNKGISPNLLTEDSSSWGNYSNTTNATLTGGKYTQYMNSSYQPAFNKNWYAYNVDLGEIVKNNVFNNVGMPLSVLLTTGSSNKFSQKNIFDLAGNLFEWTLETDSVSEYSNHTVGRGGSYYSGTGSNCPVSFRNNGNSTFSNEYYGFRVSIY